MSLMKKFLLFYSLFILLATRLIAQTGKNDWQVNAGPLLPAGEFGKTHVAGTGFSFDYSSGRLGKLHNIKKKFGFLANSGLTVYFGKKVTVAGYPYQYKLYKAFHLFAGTIYQAGKNWNMRLSGGPALTHYRGSYRFNLGSSLQASWYWKQQWGISPGLSWLKESGARVRWAAGVMVSFAF